MHHLSKLIIVIVLAGVGFIFKDTIRDWYENFALFSFCEKPIGYNLGSIDERFGVDRETLLANVEQATDIWNEAYKSPLFVYDENSKLDINLVFDERQRSLNNVNQQEQNVQLKKIELNEKLAQYEQDYRMISSAVEELNAQIEYWNNRGGAPKEVYSDLIERQDELNNQIESLNETASNVNQTTGVVNSEIDRLNSVIASFNDLLSTLPEEGIYIPQETKIDIYFYDSEPRFIHTTAHELGHALGLQHVSADEAIMNPITSEGTVATVEDLQELTTFCQEKNKIDYVLNNLQLIWQNFLLSVSNKSDANPL